MTPPVVLKSLFSLSSSPFSPYFGIQFLLTRVFSLYVELIQCRESELIALLLQIHSSSEISGSPLESAFFTLLFWVKLCVFFCLRGNFIFCKSSAVFFLRVLFLRSPVHCFFLSVFLTPLRHSSVSPFSGGEHGRDPIPGTQLDWVVWEVWVALLSSLPLTVFFCSLWGFSNYLPLVTKDCLVTEKIISFLRCLSQTCFHLLFLFVSHSRKA